MKNIFLTVLFTIGISTFSVVAQSPTTTPPSDQGDINPGAEEKVFPPEVVDSTISDTSEIDEIRIDSSGRMEDKRTFEIRKKEENKISPQDNNKKKRKSQ